MAILAKECPLCGGKMMPPRCASYLTTVDDPGLPIMEPVSYTHLTLPTRIKG